MWRFYGGFKGHDDPPQKKTLQPPGSNNKQIAPESLLAVTFSIFRKNPQTHPTLNTTKPHINDAWSSTGGKYNTQPPHSPQPQRFLLCCQEPQVPPFRAIFWPMQSFLRKPTTSLRAPLGLAFISWSFSLVIRHGSRAGEENCHLVHTADTLKTTNTSSSGRREGSNGIFISEKERKSICSHDHRFHPRVPQPTSFDGVKPSFMEWWSEEVIAFLAVTDYQELIPLLTAAASSKDETAKAQSENRDQEVQDLLRNS